MRQKYPQPEESFFFSFFFFFFNNSLVAWNDPPLSYFQSALPRVWISAQTFTWHAASFNYSTYFKGKSPPESKRQGLLLSPNVSGTFFLSRGRRRQLSAPCYKNKSMDNVPRVNLDLCLFVVPFFFYIHAHSCVTFQDITFGEVFFFFFFFSLIHPTVWYK